MTNIERDEKAIYDKRIRDLEIEVREKKGSLKLREDMVKKQKKGMQQAHAKYDKMVKDAEEELRDAKDMLDEEDVFAADADKKIDDLKTEIAKGETDIIKLKERLERK